MTNADLLAQRFHAAKNNKSLRDSVSEPPELAIFGVPYASKKVSWTHRLVGPNITKDEPDRKFEPGEPRIFDFPEPPRLPPEIMRIKRGAVHHFVGMFLNDGLETWSGLDLDRMLGVKALLDWNRKNDPVFNDWDTASFARRYTVGERRVTEVVHLLPLRLHDLGLFLCAANAAWASPYVVGEPWRQTETAVLELFLLDRMIEQDETIFYMLDISPNGSVKAGFDHALRLMERFHRRPRPQSGTAS